MKEKLEEYALSKSVQKANTTVKVGIVGCGSMGQEIAILVSKAGIDVSFVELSDDLVGKAKEGMEKMIDDIISHWGMTSGDKRAIMSRITGSTDYSVLEGSTIVIESINTAKWIPNQPVRKEVFQNIERVVCPNCVIASNASTVVIGDLSMVLKNPHRAIGLHFISPVLKNTIIEVNRCTNTADETVEFTHRFAKMIGKEIISIFGSPGNISTRLIVPMINEACELLMEGVSTVDQIDKTMTQGFGMQFGPFTMADEIGLDKVVKWMEGLYSEYGESRYKASPLIRRMIRAGVLGQKSGEGFYAYPKGVRTIKTGSILTLGKDK